MRTSAIPLNTEVQPKSLAIGRTILGVGIVWMMLGMAIMPAGVSFNPGKAYQISLAVLLYLPALILAFTQRARVWRQLWPQPLFRVLLALLAWAAVSLAWTHAVRPPDELGRLVSVLAFVLGWQAYMQDEPLRIRSLLFAVGLGIGACAAYYCVSFALFPVEDGRIIGQGTIATANYAAALMGVVALWLSQLDVTDWRWSTLRYLAMLVLLLFVGLTHTRSVWLGLAAAILLMPLWQPGRAYRWVAVVVAALAVVMLMWPAGMLMERGTSLRPELFEQAMRQVALHPFLGAGQGSPMALMVHGAAYTHTHNVFTQALVELGLPGLLLTIALWLMVAWQGWRHRDLLQGRLLLAIWVYATVVLQFDMPQMLDSPRPTWLLIWVPVGLALGLAWRNRQKPANSLH